ncbi:cytochrome P450 [Gordonia McavH-238-E]|uniref:cytochrome P450 n=1 Tax=Gordonia sp. McavH-238-E TaxID=2917736 RepID=UPI001EF4C2BE|nr:cytochrome P450 [Gordonia sp. McavH-238-E]MCG7635278.1 cytochrome P450 [Gordonia sp. McavH-238-E]
MNAKPLNELPHPAGRLPLLGDVRSADRRRPTQHEAELTRELGPIFQRVLLRDQLVVVGGAGLAKETLDEKNWGRVLVGPLAKLREFAAGGLFTARSSDPLWGQARRILTPGFSQGAMRAYHEAMVTVATDLTEQWSREPRVDVHQDMTAATLEIIGRAGFSTPMGLLGDSRSSAEGTDAFLESLTRVLVWASESTNDIPIVGPIRALLNGPGIRRDAANVRQYVDDIIARRQQRGDNVPANDLLGLMLGAEDSETGQTLPLDNVRDQVLTFLAAGHETTAALMEVALYHLAADPQLGDDITATELSDGPAFDYEQVVKMRRIKALINECLRLWPPAPGFFRIARTDQELGGYKVPRGRAVFVLSLAAQRDPSVWGPDADEFRADRFVGKRLTANSDEFFAPWGTGPRSCIGRQFAIHETTLLIASLLSKFRLTLEEPVELRMRERATLRPEPFTIVATPREKARKA